MYIVKLTRFLSLVFLLSSPLGLAAQAPTADVKFAGSVWKIGNRQASPAGTMREFVTNGESVVAWTRLLTIVESNTAIAPADAVAKLKAKFQSEGCPAADFRVLSEKPGQIIYYRGYSRCKPPDEEFNIVRFVLKGSKNHTTIYAVRKAPGEDEIKKLAEEIAALPLDL